MIKDTAQLSRIIIGEKRKSGEAAGKRTKSKKEGSNEREKEWGEKERKENQPTKGGGGGGSSGSSSSSCSSGNNDAKAEGGRESNREIRRLDRATLIHAGPGCAP